MGTTTATRARERLGNAIPTGRYSASRTTPTAPEPAKTALPVGPTPCMTSSTATRRPLDERGDVAGNGLFKLAPKTCTILAAGWTNAVYDIMYPIHPGQK